MANTMKNAVIDGDGNVYAANGEWIDLDGFVEKFNATEDAEVFFATIDDYDGEGKYDGRFLMMDNSDDHEDLQDFVQRDDYPRFMRCYCPDSVDEAVRIWKEENGIEDEEDEEDGEDKIDMEDEGYDIDDDDIDEALRAVDGGYISDAFQNFENHVCTRDVDVFYVNIGDVEERFLIERGFYFGNKFFIIGKNKEDDDYIFESFEDDEEFLDYVVGMLGAYRCEYGEDFGEFELVERYRKEA